MDKMNYTDNNDMPKPITDEEFDQLLSIIILIKLEDYLWTLDGEINMTRKKIIGNIFKLGADNILTLSLVGIDGIILAKILDSNSFFEIICPLLTIPIIEKIYSLNTTKKVIYNKHTKLLLYGSISCLNGASLVLAAMNGETYIIPALMLLPSLELMFRALKHDLNSIEELEDKYDKYVCLEKRVEELQQVKVKKMKDEQRY